MSYFITHTGCPKCGSSDAFAEYDDGHFWCFSCGHYVPAKGNIQVVERHFSERGTNVNSLPLNISLDIPKEPYKWLKSYGITDEEIVNNKLMWGDGMLIFPFYGENNEINFWQGRYFPMGNPKVYTCGFPDKFINFRDFGGGKSTRVVVVEDSVSAIKVNRVCASAELLGSNLSMHKAIGLSRVFSHLTLWLDSDKLLTATKFVNKYSSLFDKCDYIYTDKDPKEFTTEEIRKILNE